MAKGKGKGKGKSNQRVGKGTATTHEKTGANGGSLIEYSDKKKAHMKKIEEKKQKANTWGGEITITHPDGSVEKRKPDNRNTYQQRPGRTRK